jgi:hypothetical protein
MCHSIQLQTEQEQRNEFGNYVPRPSYGSKGAAIMAVPCQRCVMSQEQELDSSPLVPIEQQTILFYGKPLVVVHLPDHRPAIVLRHICDNLQLEPTSQVRRIKRTEAIADDLVYTEIQTDGGPQIMPTLVLVLATWDIRSENRTYCA